MTPQEFNFSLLLDRVVSIVDTVEMYRPSLQGGNPSMVVVNRLQDLFDQLYDAFQACEDAVKKYSPSKAETDKWEAIKIDADQTLFEFQTMVREVALKKLKDILC